MVSNMKTKKKSKKTKSGAIGVISPAKGGGINIDIVCTECGKPLDHSDKYGMWCKNECGREESKDALALLEKMIPGVFPKGWDKNFR